jgi:hypothetical protein
LGGLVSLAISGLPGTGTAQAETKSDLAAVSVGSNQSIHHQLSDSHIYVTGINIHEKITTSDPDNPLNGAAGTCSGVLEFIDGKMDASGYCRFKDTSGDIHIGQWTGREMTEDGVFKGDFTVLGGTGKWDGATGGGTFSETFNEDDTRFEVNWTGDFTLQ